MSSFMRGWIEYLQEQRPGRLATVDAAGERGEGLPEGGPVT